MLYLILLTLTSHAGKLAEGYRGIPFGPDAPIAEAPLPGCAPSPEDGIKWTCPATIGEAPIIVSYLAEEGRFLGVFISVKGYTACSEVVTVLKQAYGPGFPKHDWDNGAMADRFWRDNGAMASFAYNEFSDKATVTLFDTSLANEVKQIKADRAKGAVGDL